MLSTLHLTYGPSPTDPKLSRPFCKFDGKLKTVKVLSPSHKLRRVMHDRGKPANGFKDQSEDVTRKSSHDGNKHECL
ncbi:hypothetical protein Bca52824_024806 [Brassica carinata]|uniref:Uncharacterized protein n=1 Tax=Brassica carinata TaxID=52824 RepID=A0A8X7VL80_BRACI|nr:hypothetical protein Bca52824_024806 [Brassica carinata]